MGNESVTLKIVIVGDEDTGKLSVANTLFENPFDYEISNRSSLGIQFGKQNIAIGDKICKFHIFVTAGGAVLSPLRKKHYSGACIFFIVFDISKINTLENITSYLQEIKECVKSGIMPLVYVIGNKIDLRSSDIKCINEERAISFVSSLNNHTTFDISYNEISCKTVEKVEQLKSDFHKSLIFGLALGQF